MTSFFFLITIFRFEEEIVVLFFFMYTGNKNLKEIKAKLNHRSQSLVSASMHLGILVGRVTVLRHHTYERSSIVPRVSSSVSLEDFSFRFSVERIVVHHHIINRDLEPFPDERYS